MSKEHGKTQAKPEQKQIVSTKDKQKTKSTELTDADLDKVAGGSLNFTQQVGFKLKI